MRSAESSMILTLLRVARMFVACCRQVGLGEGKGGSCRQRIGGGQVMKFISYERAGVGAF